MGLRDYLDILLAIVAISGVVISILSYRASRKDKQPEIRVKIGNGFPLFKGGTDIGEAILILEVANCGEKTVKVVYATIALKGRQFFFPGGLDGTQRVPFDLNPNDSATLWVGIEKFCIYLNSLGYTGTQKVKAYFKDAVGNEYRSKDFKINIDVWVKSRQK